MVLLSKRGKQAANAEDQARHHSTQPDTNRPALSHKEDLATALIDSKASASKPK